MDTEKFLIVVNRGPRQDGNHGVIVARGVAAADLARVEDEYNTAYAPCETYALPDADDITNLPAERQQAVAQPVVEDAPEPDGEPVPVADEP